MPEPEPRSVRPFVAPLLALLAPLPAAAQAPIDFARLLDEMAALDGLARLPEPPFRTVQLSSTDRRSSHPDAPGWYENADGFGGEPTPGFGLVLEEPGEDGVGRYLVADVAGPGAVVRGWSAGMGGTLRVVLDGAAEPLYEGSGYDFLADRTRVLTERLGLDLELGDAFRQQDADYLPIPFAHHLRVTWEGKLDELHFYHLELRRYGEGVAVRTFDLARDLGDGSALEAVARRLTEPEPPPAAERFAESASLEPDGTWEWSAPEGGSRAIVELAVRVTGEDMAAAMRGTLLRVFFDGASRPQVEAPVGDLSGTGPGIHPFDSLPMALAPDGTVTCRFVMPFERSARVALWNATDGPVQADVAVALAPWTWDGRSLWFHAKWRIDPDLDLHSGGFDLPFVVLVGAGRLVGVASLIANPATVPHPYGSWWGEGDEKVFVDGEAFPSFLGTGSEDYYNYSWSRPDLFDHPYCGQPLNTGPGNQGFCSNHRWHVLDSVPFSTSLSFAMELWHHRAHPGLGYARLAYVYARPGALDDHRRVQRSELVVPELPTLAPEAVMGAHEATFVPVGPGVEATGGVLGMDDSLVTASRGSLLAWRAAPGDRFAIRFGVEQAGERRLSLVAAHWPDGGSAAAWLDGEPLVVDDLGGAELGATGGAALVLKSRHAARLLSTGFERRELAAGEHVLELECTEAGRFGFDYLWLR